MPALTQPYIVWAATNSPSSCLRSKTGTLFRTALERLRRDSGRRSMSTDTTSRRAPASGSRPGPTKGSTPRVYSRAATRRCTTQNVRGAGSTASMTGRCAPSRSGVCGWKRGSARQSKKGYSRSCTSPRSTCSPVALQASKHCFDGAIATWAPCRLTNSWLWQRRPVRSWQSESGFSGKSFVRQSAGSIQASPTYRFQSTSRACKSRRVSWSAQSSRLFASLVCPPNTLSSKSQRAPFYATRVAPSRHFGS